MAAVTEPPEERRSIVDQSQPVSGLGVQVILRVLVPDIAFDLLGELQSWHVFTLVLFPKYWGMESAIAQPIGPEHGPEFLILASALTSWTVPGVKGSQLSQDPELYLPLPAPLTRVAFLQDMLEMIGFPVTVGEKDLVLDRVEFILPQERRR